MVFKNQQERNGIKMNVHQRYETAITTRIFAVNKSRFGSSLKHTLNEVFSNEIVAFKVVKKLSFENVCHFGTD